MTEQPFLEPGWEVQGIRDAERCFCSLHLLLPEPAHLVFEGVSIAPDVRDLLQAAAIPPRRHVPAGTISPKPVTLHVQASAPFLAAVAERGRNRVVGRWTPGDRLVADWQPRAFTSGEGCGYRIGCWSHVGKTSLPDDATQHLPGRLGPAANGLPTDPDPE